ncbi:glyoxylase-like metal-dependent hydrolase (beta-lactamase superfamily II) [Roseovarius halotolerans]|uniref:Hydroxyacylglutathione hydrolase n=1 Tax=Roseovarius halotolerans TaxID=505353 RepID=A0A1X6YJ84_9RHOB|nr:MBL fold metallo-hydrolase [Roseovarius halotolerans]RKT34476.1 glyoxylase-like metal-dependent hydrolase (beta-lactamase superfamily II) [Roseovarius halotolerans]SLN22930.1 Hydroxyacylglutathione hydrolase [Roseovarius halotolerans]
MMPQSAFNPPVGIAEDMGRGIRRILAPNPSPMTYLGTNTYMLGETGIAVIDPGPDDQSHLAAILGALGPGQRVTHILVTHAHLDHSPLAAQLARETGAKVHAFGHARDGRSAVMERLAQSGLNDGGEGIDHGFCPDIRLADGEVVTGEGWTITALWTPGHLGNHLCFQTRGAVFTGDLVMGWASSLVSPPDGDLTDFMASCARLRDIGAEVFHSGHGAPIDDPMARLDWLISHRRAREAAVLAQLGSGPATAQELAQRIYTDTPRALLPAATRNVLAHLIDLMGKNLVSPLDPLSSDARFATT